MQRFLLALGLGLSLASCDKPGTDRASDARETQPAHEPQSRRSTTPQRSAVEPAQELRERLVTAGAIESPAAREKALAEIAWDAIEIAPETAHEAFRLLAPDSPEKLRLIRHYAMRLASLNVDEALAWAASLESEIEISAATGHIALEIAESDPVRAANLLSESGIEGRDFDVALVQVVQRWAANTPADAAAWVVEFPATPARKAAIQAVVEPWLRRDMGAAFGWADSLQDPAIRAEAIEGIQAAIQQQPEATRDEWLRHPGAQALLPNPPTPSPPPP